MQFVDEGDDFALGVGDLLQYGLEPLLELAADTWRRRPSPQVERDETTVLQALRNVAVDDSPGQTFDDRGLADAGFADQYRVVLGAPGENLDGATDLLVAADHRVELALARPPR